MAIIANNTGGSTREPAPAGNFMARCYSMIHVGTSLHDVNGEKKMQNKVRITWELPSELKVFKEENGEQPQVISKEFTLSLHEKATLRKFLASWRGKDFTEEEAKAFDISVLVGKPCMLNIIHKVSKTGNTYAEVSNVSAMPKGFECLPQINKSVIYTVTEHDEDLFKTFPDFIKELIQKSDEYKALQQPHEIQTAPDEVQTIASDDLPF